MLTDAQADGFDQLGVLTLPQLFAFDEIAWLREAAVGLAQRHGAARGGDRFAPVSLHARSSRIGGASRVITSSVR